MAISLFQMCSCVCNGLLYVLCIFSVLITVCVVIYCARSSCSSLPKWSARCWALVPVNTLIQTRIRTHFANWHWVANQEWLQCRVEMDDPDSGLRSRMIRGTTCVRALQRSYQTFRSVYCLGGDLRAKSSKWFIWFVKEQLSNARGFAIASYTVKEACGEVK